MFMCKVVSCVVWKGCLLWPLCSLDKTLLAFVMLHFVLQGPTYLLLRVSLYPLHLHFSPLGWKCHSFFSCSRRCCKTHQFHLLQHRWLRYELDHCDVEWFALEMNWDPVFFEVATKYCISDTFIDYEGYSISSEGFLPTGVDIIVIWIKFTHSCPFLFTDS